MSFSLTYQHVWVPQSYSHDRIDVPAPGIPVRYRIPGLSSQRLNSGWVKIQSPEVFEWRRIRMRSWSFSGFEWSSSALGSARPNTVKTVRRCSATVLAASFAAFCVSFWSCSSSRLLKSANCVSAYLAEGLDLNNRRGQFHVREKVSVPVKAIDNGFESRLEGRPCVAESPFPASWELT